VTDHYERMAQRVEALVRDPDVDLARPVPACPGWTAWETFCHLAASVIDGGQGRIPDTIPPSAEWTARQVADHRDRPLDDVLADWRAGREALGPAVLENLQIPLVFDGITHEHDIRAAVGRRGAEDDPTITALLDAVVPAWDGFLGDLPPIALDDGTTVRRSPGDGEPGLVLRGSAFELLRALSGRRSKDQVRAMVVEGDFDRYADRLVLFDWPEEDQP